MKTSVNYGRARWNDINDEIRITDWSDITQSENLEFMAKRGLTDSKILCCLIPLRDRKKRQAMDDPWPEKANQV